MRDPRFRALPTDLISGIRAVATGDAVAAPSLTRRLLSLFAQHFPGPEPHASRRDARPARLTGREREVLIAIANGRTNHEIAELLVAAESTVKTHIGRILAKVEARDRVQAVILAYDTGLVRPA